MSKNFFKATIPLLLLFATSCDDEEALLLENSTRDRGTTEATQEVVEGEIRLGEKINSPLLLKNMQRAADSLSKRKGTSLRSAVVLEPTHYYVRFLPKDSAEYETLVADTLLDLTPYPLDYELSCGDSYHDPSLPYDSYQWQYTTVRTNYDLEKHGIKHEVLDEIYMPNEDIFGEQESSVRSAQIAETDAISWDELLEEAIRQTTPANQTSLKAKWTPGATIKAYDDVLGTYIPLQGVKVRICVFAFAKEDRITDANGQVRFDSRRRSASYSIEWEDKNWDIRDGGTQAYYNGPRQESWWNLNIGSGAQKSLHFSAIHRALYKYYYGNVDGLIRPSKALKVSYQTGSDPDGDALGSTRSAIVRTWSWIFSAIKIYEKNSSGGIQKTNSVFSTMIHELAHASHACRLSKDDYDNTSKFVKESWASAVGWYLTLQEYERLGASTYDLTTMGNNYNVQNWPNFSKIPLIYSPLFIDMIDDYNQWDIDDTRPNDEVSGYLISIIDQNLKTLKCYNDIETFMLNNRPSNVTNSQIYTLLKLYKEKWTEK
jgi:hypothetical protein